MRIQSSHRYADRGLDAYFSPPEATAALLAIEHGRIPRWLWEPAAGDGNIVRPLRAAGFIVVASDLVDYGARGIETGIDYLTAPLPRRVQGIVTNPPFGAALKFALKALGEVPYVALLLRTNFLESTARLPFFRAHPPARIWISSRRLPMMHRHDWTGKKSASVGPWWRAKVSSSNNPSPAIVASMEGMLCSLSQGKRGPAGDKAHRDRPRCPLDFRPGHAAAVAGRNRSMNAFLCAALSRAEPTMTAFRVSLLGLVVLLWLGRGRGRGRSALAGRRFRGFLPVRRPNHQHGICHPVLQRVLRCRQPCHSTLLQVQRFSPGNPWRKSGPVDPRIYMGFGAATSLKNPLCRSLDLVKGRRPRRR